MVEYTGIPSTRRKIHLGGGVGVVLGMALAAMIISSMPACAATVKLENANITESSGITASRRNPGVYWTHNDSSAGSYIYAFDETGRDLGMFNYQAGSEDIEDIAATTINGTPYLLVGNVGSHAQVGSKRRLYLIKEPLANTGTARQTHLIPKEDVAVIVFYWPGGATWDCESVAFNSNGDIFLLTKQNPGQLFLLRSTLVPGVTSNSLRRIGTLGVNFPTGMDISQDGRKLLVVYDPFAGGKIKEFALPTGSTWGNASSSPTVTSLGNFGGVQAEGICYNLEGSRFLGTSEMGGNTGSRASGGFRPGGSCPLYIRDLVIPGPVVEPEPVVNVPTVPGNVSALAQSSSSILVSWLASTDVEGVKGYEVFSGNDKIGGTTTETSFLHSGLPASTAYSYVVRALDADGHVSPFSVTASASTLEEAVPEPPAPVPTATIYEAEKAVLFGAKAYPSFVDYIHASGDYIEWTVETPAAGACKLTFRYAHSGGNRPLEIRLNGTVLVGSLSFPATGSSSTYATVSTTAVLPAGTSKVRATAIGYSGGNMDHLSVGP